MTDKIYIIKKRKIITQDIDWDNSGTDEIVSFVGSDGSGKSGNKINAKNIPLSSLTRQQLGNQTNIEKALIYLSELFTGAGGEASTTTMGMVKLATIEELIAFTDVKKVITPALLGALKATTKLMGLIQFATDEEAKGKTVADKCISPAQMKFIDGIWQPGDVRCFYGTIIPSGWINMDGSILDRKVYVSLWNFVNDQSLVISESEWNTNPLKKGYYSAGDGSTTFRLPDLRGYFPRVQDPTGEVDPDGKTRNIGGLQNDALQQHGHKIWITKKQGSGVGEAWNLEHSEEDTSAVHDIFNGRVATETRSKNFGIKMIVKA